VFVFDAALDEIESEPRQPAPGAPAQVVDIHSIFNFHFSILRFSLFARHCGA
jgi:hypothetical protein